MRLRAALRACLEIDFLEAAERPSRFSAVLVARERLADGLRAVLFSSLASRVPGRGGSLTPARRALERPMAIACLVFRAPCLPSRI